MLISFAIFYGLKFLYILLISILLGILILSLPSKIKRNLAKKIFVSFTGNQSFMLLSALFIAVMLLTMITTSFILSLLNEYAANQYILIFTTLSSITFVIKVLNNNNIINDITLKIKNLCKNYINKKH